MCNTKYFVAVIDYYRFFTYCYLFIPLNEDNTIIKYIDVWSERSLTEFCSNDIRLDPG